MTEGENSFFLAEESYEVPAARRHDNVPVVGSFNVSHCHETGCPDST